MKSRFVSLLPLLSAAFLSLFPSSTCAESSTQVEAVASLPVGSNAHYPSFREPLVQAPLSKLPVGQVQPKGWLRTYLELQRDGLNGQLGSISAWLDKNNNQWLSDSGDHGWEEVPYWLRGYSSLAYILNDEQMKQEAQVWFDALLANIKEDGFLGPRNMEGDNPELWAQMVMLWALQTYYEHSNDPRVLPAMKNYFLWELTVPDANFLKGLWQEKRGGDNLWSVLWLYNRTGDTSVLPLIPKLHANTSNWTIPGELPNWHGVNVAQGFREPALFYMYSADPAMLRAAYDNHSLMRQRFGQVPGGMYGADENARTGYSDPRQGAESCAIVEQMASDEIMMTITGDPFWADHCEEVAFNTFPAAMTPDMKALRYITSPNMAISDEKLHGPSIDNNLRGMLSMSPFSSRCCQHNHGMGWPYFAEHLVMATADNGLAAMLYSSNVTSAIVAGGSEVTLEESTQYPFRDRIDFSLRTTGPVEFPLYLRIPAWASNPGLTVNGEQFPLPDVKGGYVRILRRWSDGDSISLSLPMKLSLRRWEANKGSVSVDFGPLTLSLAIDEISEPHDSRDRNFVQDDSHWQQGVDASLWPSYVLRPGSPWNYSLVLDSGGSLPEGITFSLNPWDGISIPFTPGNSPISFSAMGRRIPSWGYDATGMTDTLPSPDALRLPSPEPIRLIPMGAARLRISAFPASSN